MKMAKASAKTHKLVDQLATEIRNGGVYTKDPTLYPPKPDVTPVPRLHVSARVSSFSNGEQVVGAGPKDSYAIQRCKDLKKEISITKKIIQRWDHVKVGKQALADVKANLHQLEGDLAAHEIRLGRRKY